VPFLVGVFLRRLMEQLGTPKVTQIFAYGKWPCIMAMMMMINNAIYYTPHQSDPTTAKNASFRAKMCLLGV